MSVRTGHCPTTTGSSAKRGAALPLTALLMASLLAAALHAAPPVYVVDRLDDDTVGACDSGTADDCPLRQALFLANTDGQTSTVQLGDGVHTLTIVGADEDNGLTGDLDVGRVLTLEALPGTSPVIEQQTADRVLEVHGSTTGITAVLIRGVTLSSGDVAGRGGGVYFEEVVAPELWKGSTHTATRGTSPVLHLDDVTVVDNQATQEGGGISVIRFNAGGTVRLEAVEVVDNQSRSGGGGISLVTDSDTAIEILGALIEGNSTLERGGGLFGVAEDLLVQDTRILGNVVEGETTALGGGAFLVGDAAFDRTTVAWNRAGTVGTATAAGGGIVLDGDEGTSSLDLDNVTVSHNVAMADVNQGAHQVTLVDVATLDLHHSTLHEPSPTAALSLPTTNSTVRFEASIIDGGCALVPGATAITDGYSVERPAGGGSASTCGLSASVGDQVVSDSGLGTLAVYGGAAGVPTHDLAITSPAQSLVPSTVCLADDGRSASRLLLFCDAGAHEEGADAPGPWIFADGLESGDTSAW